MRIHLVVALALLLPPLALGAGSPFDFPENKVESSPDSAQALALAPGETVVDFDVSPTRPEAAVLVKTATGKQKLLFWRIGSKDAGRAQAVPSDLTLSAVAWHPLGQALFFLGVKAGGEHELLSTDVESWNLVAIHHSKNPLRRLVVGPRPFEIGYDQNTKTSPTSYRVFFGVKKANGTYATHTVTEKGEREYAVLDSADSKDAFHVADSDEQPNVQVTSSGLPASFHPAGHFLVWEDAKHCFQKTNYAGENWGKSTPVTAGKPLCGGSLSYTPNGMALLHWQSGADGATLRFDRGEQTRLVAKGVRFLSTPSSVADGKGLVGVVKEGAAQSLRYFPIETPLADVVNAWMFLESPRDRELLSANTGLFRQLSKNQLYELYDTESYKCGGYDQTTPSRPYFVTSDVFWELYASAFEGIFILTERQSAIPKFWKFVEGAHESLKAKPGSKVAKALAVLLEVRKGSSSSAEAARILKSEGVARSEVTGADFDFGNLKPRSHYVADAELQAYFRASKYLMDLKLSEQELAPLKLLPQPVLQNASGWIGAYRPFIADSKRPLVWPKSSPVPDYVLHPESREQVFPLSWGIDNEALYSAVYHDSLPLDEQIAGPNGPRLLPSGLDVAAVLGSPVALAILEETGELAKYPNLKAQLMSVKKRYESARSTTRESLYQKWLAGLATQWSEEVTSPGDVLQKKFWARKRLQTGLASWATLRHATLLVNERAEAECGESGFEQIVLRPPRGYVEPDPKLFDELARLFDATIDVVKTEGKSWSGSSPKRYGDEALGVQQGVIRRLEDSRDKARLFAAIARKELAGETLTNAEYEEILYVGRAAEHNFLVFKSLAKKDFALSTPDPIAKVADVASSGQGAELLLAGVGNPLEWDQIVPFFGRKQVVKGPSYSYYEVVSKQAMNDAEWRAKLPTLHRPKWIEPYFSGANLSCPAKAP